MCFQSFSVYTEVFLFGGCWERFSGNVAQIAVVRTHTAAKLIYKNIFAVEVFILFFYLIEGSLYTLVLEEIP